MSDLQVNFTVTELNSTFNLTENVNVDLTVDEPLNANMYVEGTFVTNGAVMSVGGEGSGLGFSLSGNVTNVGNLVLTVPNSETLKTNLSLGNIVDINLNGNSSQILDGTGTWIENKIGTVTSVTGDGSGLGFSLFGTVTTSGNVTLSTPDSATLRTNLNIGNIANLNLNGVSNQYLNGVGTWSNITINPGTVTSVTGTGSGLGFSLSGTVTDSGNITLSVPDSNTLRDNLNVQDLLFNIKVATEYVKLDWSGGNIITPYSGSLIYDNLGNLSLVDGIDIQPISPATEIIDVGQSINITLILPSVIIPDFSTMPVKIKGVNQLVRYGSYIPGLAVQQIVTVNYVIIRINATDYIVLGNVNGY